MERLNKTGFILILLILISSCSASYKFNREIKKLDKENNLANLKANKKFLKTISQELKNTNHIFYKIRPLYSYNSFEGWNAVIFDEDNHKVYKLDCDNRMQNFRINDTLYDFDEKYNQFVYDLFKNESCDTLQILSKKNSSQFIDETFYEMNLKTKLSRVCKFEEILYFNQLYEEKYGY